MFYSCSSNISNNAEHYEYYKTALKYIQNDSIAIKFMAEYNNISVTDSQIEITVSPKIMPSDLALFGTVAKEEKNNLYLNNKEFKYDQYIIDSLRHYEKTLYPNAYIDESVSSPFKNDSAQAIVFFSKYYGNFLTAELFFRDKSQGDTTCPGFCAGLRYLIIFKDRKINKVLTTIVSYD